MLTRKSYKPVKVHCVHPPTFRPSKKAEGYKVAEFNSAATKPIGRSRGPFFHRRSQPMLREGPIEVDLCFRQTFSCWRRPLFEVDYAGLFHTGKSKE
jgi:hypothetical protein